MAINKKKLTRSEITEKILKKYEVNEENLDFQTLKKFKEKMKELTDTRQPKNVLIKFGILSSLYFLQF